MCANEAPVQRMKALIDKLKVADVAYYRDDAPVMTDREYDHLTEELQKLESETGLVLSGSPTQKVSGEILEELTPVRHAEFCSACGKQLSASEKETPRENPSVEQEIAQLPVQEAARKEKKKAKKPKGKKKRRKKTEEPIPEIVGEPVDDGYDGYYNDVLPPDLDRIKEGVDKELVKRIAILAGAAIFIIGLCVGMMYIV